MSPACPIVTRFAPSPTGGLHLGHAYSALLCRDAADRSGGRLLLRIEDIDRRRCRPEFEARIYDDLAWLGLEWERPARRQSDHFNDYRAALARLDRLGVLYPCFCTRAEIKAEIAGSANAPDGPVLPDGQGGPLYPGTCRSLTTPTGARLIAEGRPHALRIDVKKAMALAPGGLSWTDVERGNMPARPRLLGDAVLARKDAPASYHLAATVDDCLQGVTLVIRGRDLAHATHLHRLLQALLGYPAPRYRHHRLVLNAEGKRLSKRDRATTLSALRAAGATPDDIRAMIAERLEEAD